MFTLVGAAKMIIVLEQEQQKTNNSLQIKWIAQEN